MLTIEEQVLKHLCDWEDYLRAVLPFVDKAYFEKSTHKVFFSLVKEFFEKYNALPSKDSLLLSLSEKEHLPETLYAETASDIEELLDDENDKPNYQWLIDETEKFCQERAVYNGIMASINIIDGTDKKRDKGAIPEILSDALKVSFDPNVGHNFFADYQDRYNFYHRNLTHIPFDLALFNQITEGGLTSKTLNIIMAGTGVGKSISMCHMAAYNVMSGFNTLYITAEMSEERIGERIDANLMNIPVNDLKKLPSIKYKKKIELLKKRTVGNLVIKEYPTAAAHVGHFRNLLHELRLKKNFVPDIIYIDYINICASSRMRGGSDNTYNLVKSIAEEIRGLAVEQNVPIVSATQTNRQGYNNSDADLTNTAESFGLPATCDLMVCLITSEEMEQLGQMEVKQLKNRYNDQAQPSRFRIGLDKPRMKLYDLKSAKTSPTKP